MHRRHDAHRVPSVLHSGEVEPPVGVRERADRRLALDDDALHDDRRPRDRRAPVRLAYDSADPSVGDVDRERTRAGEIDDVVERRGERRPADLVRELAALPQRRAERAVFADGDAAAPVKLRVTQEQHAGDLRPAVRHTAGQLARLDGDDDAALVLTAEDDLRGQLFGRLLSLNQQLIDAGLECLETHASTRGVERAMRNRFPVALAGADEQLELERLVRSANRGVDRRARHRIDGSDEEKSEQCDQRSVHTDLQGVERTPCWRWRGSGTMEL